MSNQGVNIFPLPKELKKCCLTGNCRTISQGRSSSKVCLGAVLDAAGVVLDETYGGRMCVLVSDENTLLCAKWITWIFRAFWEVCDK